MEWITRVWSAKWIFFLFKQFPRCNTHRLSTFHPLPSACPPQPHLSYSSKYCKGGPWQACDGASNSSWTRQSSASLVLVVIVTLNSGAQGSHVFLPYGLENQRKPVNIGCRVWRPVQPFSEGRIERVWAFGLKQKHTRMRKWRMKRHKREERERDRDRQTDR